MRNMMIVPTEEELKKDFALGADYYIFNAGEYTAPTQKWIPGLGPNKCCVSVNLSERRMVILGTQYGGEMKKGLFGVMHYLMPKRGILSLHSGCNVGAAEDVTLFFGLSGAALHCRLPPCFRPPACMLLHITVNACSLWRCQTSWHPN